MSDFNQDIIRTVRIETQVDTDSIKKSSTTLDNFYKKYQSNSMKVDTSDFFKAIDAVKSLRKELDTTKKNSPKMEGIIGQMSNQLDEASKYFEQSIVRFTNGDIAHGLDEVVNKITNGFQIQAVDLGNFLSTVQNSAKSTVDALKEIGAITFQNSGHKSLNFNSLNIDQLNEASSLIRDLIEAQTELDIFNGKPLDNKSLYSDYSTEALLKNYKRLTEELDIIKELNLNDEQLIKRRELNLDIGMNSFNEYDDEQFRDIKAKAIQDKEVYDSSLSNLREYVSETENLINRLENNSDLFTKKELSDNKNSLINNINQAKLQIQELQQLGGKNTSISVDGSFSEITKVLEEIKTSLQIISNMFENENASMRQMAENGVTSFKSLSEAIVSVYINLSQVQSLVDSISKKDFNITNITKTGGENSSLQVMKQQMAVARETMEHLRQLYDQAGETLQGLGSKGQIGLVMEYSKQLQELNLTEIGKSVKGANTEMKLANVLAEMQDYIDKLTQINELRNQYGLGEWKDTFVSKQKPIAKPIVQQQTPEVTNPTVIKTQETNISSITESQQMWQLKAAIDEVSNAIGRKNAGFIKEQEIVNTSVESEKAKLKELVGVLTTDIGNSLESLREKFAQSFVVPELDKNNLQTSFDEIYNKFVELKDKIQTMKIDIGINTANITTAIQEALYAKEIAANYKKVEFGDIFESDSEHGIWMNRFTGEIFDTFDAVGKEFDEVFGSLFQSKDGYFIGTKEEMFADFLSKQNVNSTLEQDNWAKVIVEAINTQGGKIVESIKLLLPKSASNGLNNTDETEFANAFQTVSQQISAWSNINNSSPGEFFNLLKKQQWSDLGDANTADFKDALHTLGLLSSENKPTFTIADQGLRNLGVAIADQFVLPTRNARLDQTSDLIPLLNEASQLGAAVPRIISAFNDGSRVFELQTRMYGKNIASDKSNPEFLNATDEQIDRLIHTFEVLSKVGLYPDFIGDNILFDKQKGFSLVDLETRNIDWAPMNTPEDMVEAFLQNALLGLSREDKQDFRKKVYKRLTIPSEQRLVNADTIANEKINSNQNKAEDTLNKVKITPTMDDGAVAKVVEENVAKNPATVKVTPIIDTQSSKTTDNKLQDNSIINSASNTEQSVDNESQSAIDAAKSFIDAANAKKQFVEANKKVAESAGVSESAVKKEAEAAKKVATDVGNTASKVSKDLAKTKDVFNNDGELIQTDTTHKFKTDKAVVSETDSTKITTDADGQEIRTTITTIVKDFEKFNKEEKKTEEAIARAQSKLDEFINKFKSKTGGNAQFVEGFSELESFTITKDNVEEAYNKITQLQAKYNELEGNFRKGQSSLNPFTNAITKASNIDNIFGDVEFKFNSLNNKSDELVYKFTRLQEASKKIKDFIEVINTNPNSITSDQFTEFSKDVGEFNLLKTQVEGFIKREKRAENDDVKKQVEAYQEILRLVKERNKALITAEKADNGSIQQKNALTDAYQIEQKLHTLGQQIVLTDKQRAELAQIREEHARKIRDIEVDATTKSKNQKLSVIEKNRAKEVENYINLIKQKNDYETKAAKGGAMQSFYNEKVNEIKEQIANNDKQAIMNQEEKNKLVAIEEEHQRKIAELKAKQDGLKGFQKQNDTLQSKVDAGYLSQDKFKNWKDQLAEYQSYLDGTVVADETTIQKKKEALTQLYDQLNKMSNASKTFFAKGGEILPVKFDSEQIKNAGQSLRELYNNLSTEKFDGMKTAVTGIKEELGRLTFTVDNGKGSLSSYMIQLDRATGATKLFKVQTQDTLTSFKQFATALKGDIKGMFSAFIGGVSGLYAAGRYIKEGIEFVKELDSALTELKKVTDETEETYDKFLDTAAKTGARIGSTLSNMTSATAEFAKLGYNIEQASKMAESALVYTNVGDNVDVETGSQSIISTMKAFGVEANNTMSIVDKFNEVGNNFAITTKGIGDALQVSASAMAEAGNSLDETIALTTAAM